MLAVGGTVLTINPDGSTSQAGWVGSGGGISIEEQPSYQEGVVSQSANNRATPNVAYASAGVNTSKIGVNTYYSVGVGFNVYNSYSPTPGWIMVGGTSAGTPQWAALIAIVDQQRVAQNTPTLDGPSQLLPALYQTYTNASPTGTNPFTDIVSGVSDTFVTNSIGQHIDTGKANLSAGPGYDLVTGLGTPRAQYLVPYLVAYGVTPAQTNTIYWTGDAGEDAQGDYNWDQPGNWSTVDPLKDNVPQDILPGPSDNVVIDLPGAVVVHSDDTYDIVSSLTVTSPMAYLILGGGTLDLSGSGSDGTFDVPGVVDFADGAYGKVYLTGGVLANADVTQDTGIAVLVLRPWQ